MPPSPPGSDTSATSPLSPTPISPFSITSIPSEATSDEQPDLGAFTTVFRALNYLQPLRVPLGSSALLHLNDTSTTTTTSTMDTTATDDNSVPRSTVWSHLPIASYLLSPTPNSPSNSSLHTPTLATTITTTNRSESLRSPFRLQTRSRSLGPPLHHRRLRGSFRRGNYADDDDDDDDEEDDGSEDEEEEDEAYETATTDRAVEIEDIDEQELSFDASESPSNNDDDIIYSFDDDEPEPPPDDSSQRGRTTRSTAAQAAEHGLEPTTSAGGIFQPSLGALDSALSYLAAEREKWLQAKAKATTTRRPTVGPRTLTTSTTTTLSDPSSELPVYIPVSSSQRSTTSNNNNSNKKRRRKRKTPITQPLSLRGGGGPNSNGMKSAPPERVDTGMSSSSPEPITTTTDADSKGKKNGKKKKGKKASAAKRGGGDGNAKGVTKQPVRILMHSLSTPSLRTPAAIAAEEEDARLSGEEDEDDGVDEDHPELGQLQALAAKLQGVFPEDKKTLKSAVPALLRRDAGLEKDAEGGGQQAQIHVFIDHSNILIGLLNYLKKQQQQQQSYSPYHQHGHRRHRSGSNSNFAVASNSNISQSLPSTSILASRPTSTSRPRHAKTPSFSKQQQQQLTTNSTSSSHQTSPTKRTLTHTNSHSHSNTTRHLSHAALALILERGRNVARRVLVTSSPLYQPMDCAERLGYEVRIYARVLDDGGGGGTPGGGANGNGGGGGGGGMMGGGGVGTPSTGVNGNANGKGGNAKSPPTSKAIIAAVSVPSGGGPATPIYINGIGGRGRTRGNHNNNNSSGSGVGHFRKGSNTGSVSGGATSTESDTGAGGGGGGGSLPVLHNPIMGRSTTTTTTTGTAGANATGPSSSTRPRYREQGVDELLQLKLHQSLSWFLDTSPPRGSTIVLATGDGNAGEFDDDGFVGPVRLALRRGWRVELYAWEEGLSRVWRREFGGYMREGSGPGSGSRGGNGKGEGGAGEGEGMFRIVGMEQFGRELLKV